MADILKSHTLIIKTRGFKKATKAIKKLSKALEKSATSTDKLIKAFKELKDVIPAEIEVFEPDEFEVR